VSAARVSGFGRRATDRVRGNWVSIVQTALAAGVAWEVATLVQPRPFFAPIAAVITLGVAAGQHVRRAVELAVGVAVGILVADLHVKVVGSPALAIPLAVGFAMAAALLLGAGQMLVNQAAVSAVLLATLGTPGNSSSFGRFFSALIGGAVAVVVGPVLFARDPLALVGRRAQVVLDEVADALEAVATALSAGDPDAAGEALALARAAEEELGAFEEAVAAARESIQLTPPRRRNLPRLEVFAEASRQVDYAGRNTRVLARAAETAAVRRVPADADLCASVRLLAQAVRALGEDLRNPEQESEARTLARRAAHDATAVLDRRSDLSANVIVSQVRSTAADILRGTGMDTSEMRVALGPYPGGQDA
jgi:uncharacterized membrane protein YgaE (UPF0421/DUF939 family)